MPGQAMSSEVMHATPQALQGNFNFNLFHPFDNSVYRIHPAFLTLSFYNSI